VFPQVFFGPYLPNRVARTSEFPSPPEIPEPPPGPPSFFPPSPITFTGVSPLGACGAASLVILFSQKRAHPSVDPPRSDYDAISRYYDRVRGFGPQYHAGWVEAIVRHGGLRARRRVLDVGCGTGRYTSILAAKLGRPIVGLDLSAGMLERARDRSALGDGQLRLVQGDALSLPFKEGSFDAATLFLVVHHLSDHRRLGRELLRALAPGGRALVMTRDHDEIEGSYIALFPGVLEIDLARFPRVDRLEGDLRAAGLVNVGHAREENPGYSMSIEEVMARVDGKFISTLSLMAEEQFVRSREVFRERLAARYGEGPVPTASFTFVWAERPA